MLKQSKIVFTASFLSLLLSLYTEYIKRQLTQNKDFVPICDTNGMKCSVILKSDYSTGFGLAFLPEFLKVSNSLYGIAFYSQIMLLSLSESITLVEITIFLLSLSIWMSIYLAYTLFFVIQDVCIFCVCIYILNFVSIVAAFKKYSALKVRKIK